MLVLGGVRGGISIGLVLSIPDGHRHGDVRRRPVFGSGTVVVGQRRRKAAIASASQSSFLCDFT
jgi:hypothetical protein